MQEALAKLKEEEERQKREEEERIKRLEELEAKRKEEVCFCEVADIDTFYLNPLLITHLQLSNCKTFLVTWQFSYIIVQIQIIR